MDFRVVTSAILATVILGVSPAFGGGGGSWRQFPVVKEALELNHYTCDLRKWSYDGPYVYECNLKPKATLTVTVEIDAIENDIGVRVNGTTLDRLTEIFKNAGFYCTTTYFALCTKPSGTWMFRDYEVSLEQNGQTIYVDVKQR